MARNIQYHVIIRQMIAMPNFHLKQSIQTRKQMQRDWDDQNISHQVTSNLNTVNGNCLQPSLTQLMQNLIILRSTSGSTAMLMLEKLMPIFADQWLRKATNIMVGRYRKTIMTI